jgi:hypothetical protein
MRLHHHTVVRQRCHRVCHLQWRESILPLTDAQRNGVTRNPALLLRFLKSAALPFGRRQNTGTFMLQIDTGFLAETKVS